MRAAPAPSRARVIRWPAALLLAAVVALMVIVDEGRNEVAPTADILLERPIVPTAGRAEALSSTWYCAAGTIGDEGFADHTLVLGNPADSPAQIRLTLHPVLAPEPVEIDLDAANLTDELDLDPPEAVDLGARSETVAVPGRSVEFVRLGDFEDLLGEHAAVLVESDKGSTIVEHIVSGPAGASLSTCASTSADAWHFAAGTTRKGAREVISIFNPFPGDAVIDMEFTADGSVRSPRIYSGLVIPSGAVLPVEITDVVTLFDTVSARISVRTGRVVADRLMSVEPDPDAGGGGGLSVAVGAVQPSDVWVFPAGGAPATTDAIVITNPSTTDEAEVDVEIRLDVPEFNGTVEPVGLKIRPGRTEVVVLAGASELVSSGRPIDASARILDDVGYWAAVRSLNGVPVVAERLTIATEPTPAFAAAPGLPVAATSFVMTTGDGGGEIVVVNPAADRIAQLDIRVMFEGQEFQVSSDEVGQQARLVLDTELLGIPGDAVVRIEATAPVFVERRMSLDGRGAFTVPGIPVSGTTSTPDLPLS